MFNIDIAGHTFRVDNKYEYVKRLCRDYITVEQGGFPVSVTESELLREVVPEFDYPDSYLESTAVYRKICEHLIPHDLFLFHSSALSFDGKGLLFAAPSGTGKSTHARLWKEYFRDRVVIINDDKPLIRIRDYDESPIRTENDSNQECDSMKDRVVVYGTPWSGKHSMQSNTSAPVHALFLLERGETNAVRRISRAEAYPWILRQTYMPDDAKLVKQTLKLVNCFITQVPVYRLQCNISHEAVLTALSAVM